jgi:hypothetical protein
LKPLRFDFLRFQRKISNKARKKRKKLELNKDKTRRKQIKTNKKKKKTNEINKIKTNQRQK